MKFGIMNAWYVPGGTDALDLRQDQTAINTFPVLFDRYFGLDYPLLPDRAFASTWGRPYRSIEITDRLPSRADPAPAQSGVGLRAPRAGR